MYHMHYLYNGLRSYLRYIAWNIHMILLYWFVHIIPCCLIIHLLRIPWIFPIAIEIQGNLTALPYPAVLLN